MIWTIDPNNRGVSLNKSPDPRILSWSPLSKQNPRPSLFVCSYPIGVPGIVCFKLYTEDYPKHTASFLLSPVKIKANRSPEEVSRKKEVFSWE